MFRLILSTACVCLLLLHLTDGAALGGTCAAAADCKAVANSVCNAKTKKCECAATFEPSGAACKKANDQACTADAECASGHCKDQSGAKKCVAADKDSGASGIAACLVLLLMALVTPRFF